MRRLVSLLALLVMAWSNAAAFPCGSPARSAPGTHPDGAHAHTGHGPDHGAPADPDQEGAGSGDLSPDCGVLMACGAFSRGTAPPGAQALVPPRLDDAPTAPVPQPSTADLTQDPPPPRLA